MRYFTVDLYEYFKVNKKEGQRGFLTCYIIDNSSEINLARRRPAMLVIPGGGYAMTSDREREPIALAYLNKGFCAFTLDYSVAPERYPTQFIEGAMAVAYIKENADDLNVNKNTVAGVGFSAGGHLCASLATMYDSEEIKSVLKSKASLCKLDAVVLGYPVITSGEFAHEGSFINLCGENKSLMDSLSIENKVDKNSVPAFIWCTANDQAVPSENSLLLASAYKKAGVPFEIHVYENGLHGIALATNETCNKETDFWNNFEVETWLNLSVNWLKIRGFGFEY